LLIVIEAPEGDLIVKQSLLAERGVNGAPETVFFMGHDKPWIDDRRVLSSIIFVNRNVLQ
jgi:hypothetical protein